jgi:hypothetical protein
MKQITINFPQHSLVEQSWRRADLLSAAQPPETRRILLYRFPTQLRQRFREGRQVCLGIGSRAAVAIREIWDEMDLPFLVRTTGITMS